MNSVLTVPSRRRRAVGTVRERASCRPDFEVLVYPVITMSIDTTHKGSRKNLLGADPSPFWLRYDSNERNVSPRTFPVHSRDDGAVPVANSELFHAALVHSGVEVELATYEQGGHGFGFGREDLDGAAWPERCATWPVGR